MALRPFWRGWRGSPWLARRCRAKASSSARCIRRSRRSAFVRPSSSVSVCSAAVIGVTGMLGALAFAVAVSPLTPVGEARAAEPTEGFLFDTLVFGLGTVAIVAVVLLLAAYPSWRDSRVRATLRSDDRPAVHGPSTGRPGTRRDRRPAEHPDRDTPCPRAGTGAFERAGCDRARGRGRRRRRPRGDDRIRCEPVQPAGHAEALRARLAGGRGRHDVPAGHRSGDKVRLGPRRDEDHLRDQRQVRQRQRFPCAGDVRGGGQGAPGLLPHRRALPARRRGDRPRNPDTVFRARPRRLQGLAVGDRAVGQFAHE